MKTNLRWAKERGVCERRRFGFRLRRTNRTMPFPHLLAPDGVWRSRSSGGNLPVAALANRWLYQLLSAALPPPPIPLILQFLSLPPLSPPWRGGEWTERKFGKEASERNRERLRMGREMASGKRLFVGAVQQPR